MKLRTGIIAAVAAVATAGSAFAVQAYADGAEDTAPPPAASSSSASEATVRRVWAFYAALDADQRQCVAAAAVQRPEGRLSDDRVARLRAEVDAVLAGCGVAVPARLAQWERLGFGWASLSPEQQQCLADAELTRPLGRLTAQQRAAVRDSLRETAASCGIGV